MRKIDIVHILYESATFQHVSELAKQLQVSERTIRSEIKDMMKDSQKYGFEIELRRGKGYYLIIHDQKQLKQYLEKDMMFDPVRRIDTEIVILLLEDEFVSQDVIATMFGVTKPVVRGDMDKIACKLQEYHLQLKKKSHYGVKIYGSSYDKKCMLTTLYQKGNQYLLRRLQSLNVIEIQQLEKHFLDCLNINGLTANYWDYVDLDAYLKITLLNIKNDIDMITSYPYQSFAIDLFKEMKQIFTQEDIDINSADFAKFMENKVKTIATNNMYDEVLKTHMDQWLYNIDQRYNLNSSCDEGFKKSILAHMSLLIDRLSQNISYNNPLVKEISAKYPVVFNAAICLKEEIEAAYQVEISQDEIGFIATHFAAHVEKSAKEHLSSAKRIAVLCSTGGGSAFLIKLKLEGIFHASVIETFSFTQIQEAQQFRPDIVFSIKDLENVFHVPVILIGELLEEQDLLRIRDMFSWDYQRITNDNLLFLLHEDLFYVIDENLSYHAILNRMVEDLVHKAYAHDQIIEQVFRREKVMSTIFDKGVAIPHPMESCCLKESISIAIVKQAKEQVQLIFLVNLKNGSIKIHQEISKMVFRIIENDTQLEDLKRSVSFEEVYSLLKEDMLVR